VRARARFITPGAGLLAVASLFAGCSADPPSATGAAEQAVVNPPLPSTLNLILHAKTTVTIGPFAVVSGDVASAGPRGSVLFDVSSGQFFDGNVLANTVTVKVGANVGHVFGNDITVDGFASQQTLGLDPTALPPVPAVTAATPGTTNISVAANQSKQLCPGQYGAMTLGANARLNLNGGVYQVSRLSLADGARLEPSEPVVILVAGNLTTGTNAVIAPHDQALNPMFARDIRVEVGGAVTIGDSNRLRVHLLAPNGKLTAGNNTFLTGAAWAKTLIIGAESVISGEGAFAAQAPTVPPPCNDNNACTADQCVATGTIAVCRNTPLERGASCEDGSVCNGAETCDGAGTCDPGTPPVAGTSCADGDACNGDETCDGAARCVPGAAPDVNDRNACTADACDAATGVSHVPLPDGTTCSGIGVCEAGTCSVQGAVFSEDFFHDQNTTAQCDRWNNFLFSQLTDGSYSSISMSGTFDLLGVTCSEPSAATQICRALHDGNFASVACNGRTWNVGQCGGTELSADGITCVCSAGPGHVVRPCIGAGFWGGVNTPTCDAVTQTMTVVCQ
jgi:hypothetical protein